MTRLTVYPESEPASPRLRSEDFDIIRDTLASAGVLLERWQAGHPVTPKSTHEEILAAYDEDIQALVARGGYQSWDVVSMHPAHPDKTAFREKFLNEHTHGEDEVRFFVHGAGLFTLHIDGQVYELLCTQGDLVSVPAGTRHWFDMGPNPEFTAIRLFNNPEGWVARFTGSDIAQQFPRLEN